MTQGHQINDFQLQLRMADRFTKNVTNLQSWTGSKMEIQLR